MNESPSRAASTITAFFGDGPWRSKSVLSALAAVVVGVGSWFSGAKGDETPNEKGSANASPPGITAPGATSDASGGQLENQDKPFPKYVPFCASYAVAYCVGWLFRKLMRLIFVTTAVVIAVLAAGKFAGWDLTHTQAQVKRGSEWARNEAAAKRDYLLHLLPSAAGGGAGIFLGFRRRNRTTPTK